MVVRIILSHSQTITAKVVRAWTAKYYSHASIIVEGDDKIYSFARKYHRLILPGGFVVESGARGFYTYHPEIRICILELDISEENKDSVLQRLDFIKTHSRLFAYNILGLPLAAMQIPYDRKWRHTCSSFVAYVLGDCLELTQRYSLVRPDDFLHLGLKKVYEGPIGSCELLSNAFKAEMDEK